MEPDSGLYVKALPIMTEMMVSENHTMAREAMHRALTRTLKKHGTESEIGKLIVEGFNRGVAETQVLEGPRGREGTYNITIGIGQVAKLNPETGPQLAALLVERGLSELDDDELRDIVSGGRFFKGFLDLSTKLKSPAREQLEDLLYTSYRPELSKRLKAGGGTDTKMIDSILGLIQLRDEDAGWEPIGSPKLKERIWQYTSFDPTAEKDIMPKREGRRYRKVSLPADLEGWFMPEFDARNWKSGIAPVGKGSHPRGAKDPNYPSTWGEGEILLARTTFDLDRTDYDLYRLRTLCNNGFIVYLNGKNIQTFTWWKDPGQYAKWPMDPKNSALLKKGTNTIAVYAIAMYPSAHKSHWKPEVFGEMNVFIEGLRKEDLY
jgi:hypothetical protein